MGSHHPSRHGAAGSQDGNYLGRTTELPSLMPRLGGINKESQSQIKLLDTGDSVVLVAWLQLARTGTAFMAADPYEPLLTSTSVGCWLLVVDAG